MRDDAASRSSPPLTAPSTAGAVAGRYLTSPRGRLLVPTALLLAALAALAVDCRLARWLLADNCPHFVRDLMRVSELFGHGLGVLLIVLIVYQLDRARRAAIPVILGAAYGAGLAANMVKLLVTRVRPNTFDFSGDVWSTFRGVLPLASGGSDGQSFPSAHVATATGLAVALVWLYPAGRRVFSLLVVLVASQRIETRAHYLSDVLVGAAIGFVTATWVIEATRSAPWLARLSWRLLRTAPASPARYPAGDPMPPRCSVRPRGALARHTHRDSAATPPMTHPASAQLGRGLPLSWYHSSAVSATADRVADGTVAAAPAATGGAEQSKRNSA